MLNICVASLALLTMGFDVGISHAAPRHNVVTSGLLSLRKTRSLGSKISTPLTLLSEQYNASATLRAQGIANARSTASIAASIGSALKISTNSVLVNVTTTGGTGAADLKSIGMQITGQYKSMVSGYVPVSAIAQLAKLKSVVIAQPDYGYVLQTGSVLSQGDKAQRSDVLRTNTSLTGAGQMVGVMSDSFDTGPGSYADDQASGDLPSGVNVIKDSPNGTDEGRAMAQIVNDVAPGAKLAFATADGGEAAFANNITSLKNAGCTVIVDDVHYLQEPMFMDGIIAQSADAAVSAGVSFFSAAGNQAHSGYQNEYQESGSTLTYNGLTESLHDFDPGPGVDSYQSITIPAGGSVSLMFQWDDAFKTVAPGSAGAQSDFDIFLLDAGGTDVLAASASDNIGNDPFEYLTYSNTGTTAATYNLAIGRYTGTGNPQMKYVDFGSLVENEFALNTGTLYGHANAAKVAAVAAAQWSQTPPYGVTPPVVEYFSSAGGTPILRTTAGDSTTSSIRPHPDFTAPDGADTTFFGQQVNDGDSYPNFYGTSAAAPHAAGVAALMLQNKPGLTPSQLISALKTTAIDMGDSGYDYDSGSGLIDAVAAVDALSNFDTTPPTVASIKRDGASPTGATTVAYTVTFSEDVTGVDKTDFAITKSGSLTNPTVTLVSGSGSTYTVTVGSYTKSGALRLDVSDDDTIKDASGHPLGGSGSGNGNFTKGEIYTITSNNSAPVVSSVTLSPASPKTNDSLKATAVASDANGDALTFAYTWKKTVGSTITTLSTKTNTLDLSKSGNGDAGNVITVSVVANDGETNSEAKTASATVVDTAPVVTSITFSPSAPTTISKVKAVPVGSDADGNAVTYTYAWKKTVGTKTTTLLTTSNTLDLGVAGNGDLGNVISVTVTARANRLDSGPLTASFTVGNTAPVVTAVTLAPTAPLTTDKIKATVTGSDLDGSKLTYIYTWKKKVGNTTTTLSETTSMLDLNKAGNGDKGNVITVSVVASDGVASSAPHTASVTVQDTAPKATKVVLTPSLVRTNDILTATATGTDIDNDALKFSYVWQRNGKVISGASGNKLNLSVAGYGDVGETITVIATASDGTLSSSGVSASTTVANTVPEASIVLTPTGPKTNSVLTARGVVKDPDYSKLTYVFEWTVTHGRVSSVLQTKQNTTGSDTFNLSLTGHGDAGDIITVKMTVSDGSASVVSTAKTTVAADSASAAASSSPSAASS